MPIVSDLWRANARKALRAQGNVDPTKYEVAKMAHKLYLEMNGRAMLPRRRTDTKKYRFGMWDSSPQGAKNLRFCYVDMRHPDKPGHAMTNAAVREKMDHHLPMWDAVDHCPVRWNGERFERWEGVAKGFVLPSSPRGTW
jgi:hypothetical protein